MAPHQSHLEQHIAIDICGVPTMLHLRVDNTFKAVVDFQLRGSTYSFVISKWMGQGMQLFATHFHNHTPRDKAMFGTFVLDPSDPTGTTRNFAATAAQKTDMIRQAVLDVFVCLNKIAEEHKRGMMDYAIWYRVNHKELDSYSDYITHVACSCVVHSDFLAPNVIWTLVKFGM